ncbi:hypothetical protein [Herbidospora sp. NBRC 101105]|uniref:hypothetical protein n=1 Tax=Herbidospora sp. NBRC 101105 TaxID=3032195 RepID=UPI002556D787|nr:hypothetical protein [Herbidospora sp. NBRC 101105]
MDDADGDLHPGGDGADGFPATVAVENGGTLVIVDDKSGATRLGFDLTLRFLELEASSLAGS